MFFDQPTSRFPVIILFGEIYKFDFPSLFLELEIKSRALSMLDTLPSVYNNLTIMQQVYEEKITFP